MRQFVLRIENYIPLIVSISAEHWKKLPQKTKAWIEQDDFTNDGITFARYEVMPHFNPQKKAKFSTYLFVALHRYYRGLRESLNCEKRWMTVSAAEQFHQQQDFKQHLYVEGQEALQTICVLYDQASYVLRELMEDWFFSDEGPKRVMKHGDKFKLARREFLEKSKRFGITIETVNAALQATRMGVRDPELLLPEWMGEDAR